MRKTVIAIIIGLFFINGVSAEIWFNEIMPHTNNLQGIEWVELYNDGNDVSLENWKIGDLADNDTISLNISAEDFGLIIDGNQEDCSLFDVPEESCFALGNIGRGLNDDSYLFWGLAMDTKVGVTLKQNFKEFFLAEIFTIKNQKQTSKIRTYDLPNS